MTPKPQETLLTRESLIKRISEKYDEKAWEEFILFYEDYLKIICKKITQYNEELADELYQHVLVKVWKMDTSKIIVDEHRKFRNLLFTIAKNSFIDEKRKKKVVYNDLSLEVNDHHFEDNEVNQKLNQEWEEYLFSKAWTMAKEKFNDTALTCYQLLLDGLSPNEISQKLNMNTKTIYTNKSKMTNYLKNCIHTLKIRYE